jgi:carboxymethylenebutenolidase
MPTLNPLQQTMLAVFQKHVKAELDGDIETTMATMTDETRLNHVPPMTGGVGREGVRNFYTHHLVGKFFPPDVEMLEVSRTIGEDQIVDELVIHFTHTMVIEWTLPRLLLPGREWSSR